MAEEREKDVRISNLVEDEGGLMSDQGRRQ